MAIQYTIRNIPPKVDKALKRRAKLTRKSFNQTVVDSLTFSAGANKDDQSLDWLLNTMTKEDAEAFDEAMADFSKVDPDFWK